VVPPFGPVLRGFAPPVKFNITVCSPGRIFDTLNFVMRHTPFPFCFFVMVFVFAALDYAQANEPEIKFFEADNKHIQYTGRVDFSDPKKPKFWQPGIYIQAKFRGSSCDLILNDEMPNGQRNYVTLVIDNQAPRRIRTTGKTTIVKAAEGLPGGTHTITVIKATEAGSGYLEFMGFICEDLVPFGARPERTIEFIGNSITSSAGSDASMIACDKGQWYDQHNAYMSYGPMTARALNAQWQLSAVSGIGLMKSYGFDKTMPQVYDKMDMRNDARPWNFNGYTPDVVTVCLGENDGPQDSVQFTKHYIAFIGTLRRHYPTAHIVCLTSPMAEPALNTMLQHYLAGIVNYYKQQGEDKVSYYAISKAYTAGCGGHPSQAQHQEIASELTAYLKTITGW